MSPESDIERFDFFGFQVGIRNELHDAHVIGCVKLLGSRHFESFRIACINGVLVVQFEKRSQLRQPFCLTDLARFASLDDVVIPVWRRIKGIICTSDTGNEFETVIEQFDFILKVQVCADRFGIGEIAAATYGGGRCSERQIVRYALVVVVRIGFVALEAVGQCVFRGAEIETGRELHIGLIEILTIVGVSGCVKILVCFRVSVPSAIGKRAFLGRIGKTPDHVVQCRRIDIPVVFQCDAQPCLSLVSETVSVIGAGHAHRTGKNAPVI